MPQISIGDFTNTVQIDLDNNSLLGKSQLQGLKSAATTLIADLPKPVAGSSFQDATFAATFGSPTIPVANNALAVNASVNSTITLAGASDSPLFGPDDYDAISINDGDYWISFELDTLLNVSVAVPLPDGFGVGFGASTAPNFASYLFIPAAQAGTMTLSKAIGDVLNDFKILDSAEHVLAVPSNVICSADLSGTITISGTWSLPLAVNQLSLADANLPFNANVSVSPALTLSASGDIAISSEFNVRVHRVDDHTIRFGVYKKKQAEFDASFTAAAGINATLGNTDLISEFFTAVAPGIDQGGLTDDDFANIQPALNNSINRSLSISLNAACSASSSDEAAVLYEIDLSAGVLSATTNAISKALQGDWTAFRSLSNAKKLRNVIIDTVEKQYSLNVNILGMYNYASTADFVRELRVLHNDEDGSVVITDSATASRISVASTPLAADGDKLRAALYEGFVATATYKAMLAGIGASANFSAEQDFLLYRDKLPWRSALKQLNVGESLGVLPPSVKSALPAVGIPVSHARFAAQSVYSNDDVLRFFFSDITQRTPRKKSDLVSLGRTVLASLLDPQDPVDNARISVLQDDGKWAEMDANPAQILPPYSADWYDITTWADAIVAVGPALVAVFKIRESVAGDPSTNPAFMKARAKLAHAIDQVTHDTKAAFEPGFPICVMTKLCGGKPSGNPSTFQAGWNSASIFSNKTAARVKSASE